MEKSLENTDTVICVFLRVIHPSVNMLCKVNANYKQMASWLVGYIQTEVREP